MGLKDACVRRDFYRIYHHFSVVEEFIIRNMYKDEEPFIKATCEEELNVWQKQTALTQFFKNAMPEETKLLENFEIQSGELYQTALESFFYDIIKEYVSKEDSSFLNSNELKTKFCIGIASQYLRTSGLQEKQINATKMLLNTQEYQNLEINAEQLSLITAFIFTIKMAGQLAQRKNLCIEYLKTDKRFLTSDMPIVHIGKRDKDGKALEMVFFFPVNPKLAIVFPSNNSASELISEKELDFYNNLTIVNANKFFFEIDLKE